MSGAWKDDSGAIGAGAMAVVVAALGGAALAATAGLGLVQAASSTPEPVSEPLVQYGER